jgi:hypothetical protein
MVTICIMSNNLLDKLFITVVTTNSIKMIETIIENEMFPVGYKQARLFEIVVDPTNEAGKFTLKISQEYKIHDS